MTGFDVAAYVPRMLLARPADAAGHWTEEGTLLFLDITGFTRLSDQLMRRGREGAEDLVSSLVRIFTLLLSASDDGGDVLKFGGDAMLILYTGPDHARRAVHAAHQAQRVLRVVGRIETSGARTTLNMSCGIESGRFDFLLHGRLQRNLVVTGPSTTRVLELERHAGAGQVLLGEAAAAAMPRSWLGDRVDGGTLVRRVSPLPSSGSQILFRHPDEAIVWPYLPVIFRQRPDLLRSPPDHRRAAMAFVHVTGVDALVAADPEEALRRAELLADVVEHATAEAGVCIVDTDVGSDGYKYFLAAGAPEAVEDPEGRMLRALLEVAAADTGLVVRAGMASGQVFAGTVGAPFRSTYAAMGDTTNTAARLCAKAAPGEVLALGSALDRSLTAFTTTDEREVVLRGKSEPIRVGTVGSVAGPRGREIHDVPFVGRARELGVLAAALAEAESGIDRVVAVVGEEGLGKSRLVQEAVRRAGADPVVVTADPYAAQVPHHVLRLLLRQLLGLGGEDDANAAAYRLAEVAGERCPDLLPWLPLLAPAVGADVSATRDVQDLAESFRLARFHDAVRTLLAALLPSGVVVVEDAHWVDESSADALAHAFSGGPGRAVLLTRRPGTQEGLRAPAEETVLDLDPLAEDEARALLRDVDTTSRPDELRAVLGRGAGNPYFLLALAGRPEGSGLPGSVEELVGARIDRLEGADRELLRRAAVLGSRFPIRLYERATGDAGFADAVAGRMLGAFLETEGGGTVAFRREIYREVAYGQLTFRARRQLHLQTAQALEADSQLAGDAAVPMLSLHYAAAHQWAEAHQASVAAAEAARRAWAHEDAVRFCERALVAGRRSGASPEDLRVLHERIGFSCNVVGRFEEARTAFRRAMRGTDPARQVDLLIRAGRADTELGRYAGALRAYRRARELADGATGQEFGELRAEIDVEEAGTRFLQGRLAECCRICERVLEIADTLLPGEGTSRLRARAMYLYDAAAGDLDGAQAVRYGEEPLRIFEGLGDLYYQSRVSNNLGVEYLQEGRWDEAVAVLTRGGDVAQRAGDLLTSAIMAINLGELLCYRGLLEDAERELREARATATSLGVPRVRALAGAYLAMVLVHAGALDEAATLLADAEEVLTRIGSRYGVDEVSVRRAQLALARGDLVEAGERAAALLGQDGVAPLHLCLAARVAGQVDLGTGRPSEAAEHLSRSVEFAADIGADYERATSLLLLAGLGGPGAESARAEALTELARLGAPPGVDPSIGRQGATAD